MSDHNEDGTCFYCGRMTESHAGNPGLWPLVFAQADGTGLARHHHVQCVQDRLAQAPHVPVSRSDMANGLFYILYASIEAFNRKLWDDGFKDQINSDIWTDFARENADRIAKVLETKLPTSKSDKSAGQSGKARLTVEQFNLSCEMASEFLAMKPLASKEAKQAFVTDIFVNKMTMAIKNIALSCRPTPDTSKIDAAVEFDRWWTKNKDRFQNWSIKAAREAFHAAIALAALRSAK